MFNLRRFCRKLIPQSICLVSNVQGVQAENTLHKTELKLLEIRIRQCIFTLKKLRIEEENAIRDLNTKLSKPEVSRFRDYLSKAKQKHFEKVKSRQQDKFNKLLASKFTDSVAPQTFDLQERWVKNVSSKTLDAPATNLLRKGLNFAVTPKSIPTEEIITSTELACKDLNAVTAASLRSEVARSIKRRKNLKPNLPIEEIKALQELKKDQTISILPADKGRATVVMDRSDYENKIKNILSDTKTYEPLKKDPTTTFKNKLINTLKEWKKEGRISQNLYRQIYPTSDQPPKFYGLPKIHKPDLPLRPIVSGNGSVTEPCAKHLAKILNAVKGKNPHAIKNSQDFVEKIKDLEVPPGRKMVSFDVSALFTSIPVDLALHAIQIKLEKDKSWMAHTELHLDQVLALLALCLTTTYFVFRGQFYRQKFGAPMGSPISPGVADLCMEVFEEETLAQCPPHLSPEVWYRYVDDTFASLHEYAIEEFTLYLNSRNPHIQFTREVEENNCIPFLDVCVNLMEDATVKTTVYRKPTHTDQYLNWDSNHPLDHKRSVVRTLLNRAETHVSDPLDRHTEKKHVHQALLANGYKDWSLKIPNQSNKKERQKDKQANQSDPKSPRPLLGLPYVKGLSEELQRVFINHGVNIYHKPVNTLRSFLVRPKDPTPIQNQCGVVYNIPCNSCEDSYVGETARKMGTRFTEHTRSDKESALLEHITNTGHSVSLEDVRILAREPRFGARKIKEALEIYKHKPSLNRDQGLELHPVLLQLLTPPDQTPRRRGTRVGMINRDRANSL